MNITVKALAATFVAFVLSAVSIHETFAAITLNGTIPVGKTPVVVIQPNRQRGATGILKFKFSAPSPGAYSLSFCIGPMANPCGMPSSYVVVVPGGQERLAVVDASFFATNVLVVGQGTKKALPFAVTIE